MRRRVPRPAGRERARRPAPPWRLQAFRELVTAHQPALAPARRRRSCRRSAVAEEVVQETWIAVISGIDRFEQRSTLKTWITRILVNIARTKGVEGAPHGARWVRCSSEPPTVAAVRRTASSARRDAARGPSHRRGGAIFPKRSCDVPCNGFAGHRHGTAVTRTAEVGRDVERCRGLVVERRVRRARHHRGQPARAACTAAGLHCGPCSSSSWGRRHEPVPAHRSVCQEWTELITDYLEGALPRRLVKAIDRHLAGCPHCTEYLAQMRRTIDVTGALPPWTATCPTS